MAGDRTITLTSQRGRVPVTIVSAAPYPVSASLTLTSDKLLFADHSTSMTQPVVLQPGHTNVVYVNVQARASGMFKVGIVLRSPAGGLVLSSGQVSVRSTATSVVGIVLSLGAVVRAGGVVDPHLEEAPTRPPRRAAGRGTVEPAVTG